MDVVRLISYMQLIKDEIERAHSIHGEMPRDLHQAMGIVTEEVGELAQAINQARWGVDSGNGKYQQVWIEGVHVLATVFRLLDAVPLDLTPESFGDSYILENEILSVLAGYTYHDIIAALASVNHHIISTQGFGSSSEKKGE